MLQGEWLSRIIRCSSVKYRVPYLHTAMSVGGFRRDVPRQFLRFVLPFYLVRRCFDCALRHSYVGKRSDVGIAVEEMAKIPDGRCD